MYNKKQKIGKAKKILPQEIIFIEIAMQFETFNNSITITTI